MESLMSETVKIILAFVLGVVTSFIVIMQIGAWASRQEQKNKEEAVRQLGRLLEAIEKERKKKDE
jgi:hypothetical protein